MSQKIQIRNNENDRIGDCVTNELGVKMFECKTTKGKKKIPLSEFIQKLISAEKTI